MDALNDPLEVFRRTTKAIETLQAEVDKLAEIRAVAVATLYEHGGSYSELATKLGISPTRVGQILAIQRRRSGSPIPEREVVSR